MTYDLPGVPLAIDGTPARVGTLGRWMCPDDVIATEPAIAQASGPLHLGFPRNWPAAFKSTALKELINGELNGVRCRATATPPSGPDASLGAEHAAALQPMHSFSNAERLTVALPDWRVVKGFVIYESYATAEGTSFVAFRHWWVATPSGAWLDFTPSLGPATTGKVLLVESGRGEKHEVPLSGACQAFAILLGERLANRDAHVDRPGASLTPPDQSPKQADAPPLAQDTGGSPPLPPLPPLSSESHSGNDRVDEAQPGCQGSALTPEASTACAVLDTQSLSRDLPIVEQQAADTATGGESADELALDVDARLANADLLKAQADLLFRNGRVEDAERLYEKIAEPIVAAAVAAKEAGNLAFKSADYTSANAAYETGLRHIGLDVSKYNYYNDQAEAECGRILRQKLPSGLILALHSNRAAALLRLGRFAEAEAAASKALKEKPNDYKARGRRAAARRALGGPANIAGAATDYAYVLQIRPSDSGGWAPLSPPLCHDLTGTLHGHDHLRSVCAAWCRYRAHTHQCLDRASSRHSGLCRGDSRSGCEGWRARRERLGCHDRSGASSVRGAPQHRLCTRVGHAWHAGRRGERAPQRRCQTGGGCSARPRP